MVKISIAGHELEFEKELVEAFEYEVCDSFVESAKVYLCTDFAEKTLEEVFAKHTEQEINNVIIHAVWEELLLRRGLV